MNCKKIFIISKFNDELKCLKNMNFACLLKFLEQETKVKMKEMYNFYLNLCLFFDKLFYININCCNKHIKEGLTSILLMFSKSFNFLIGAFRNINCR